MIHSFKDKETKKVYTQLFSQRLPQKIQKTALRKLVMIDAASSLEDLKIPPGNRLEELSGSRAGQHSIRVNDQYRICFRYADGDFYDVEIVDYH